MSYDKLKEFVEEQKIHGVAEANVRSALLEKGWNSDLINKAVSEVFVMREEGKQEKDSTKIKGLLTNTWNNFTDNLSNYLVMTLISVFLPFIPLILFSAPIVYDILVLKFTIEDFTSGAIMPLMIFYALVSFIIIMVFALWGKLSLMMIATSKIDASIKSTLRKAWKSLTGYIWISFLTFVIVAGTTIPALAIISVMSLRLIPNEFTILFLGAAIILFIPAIIASVFLSFAPYSFVIHGSRGMTAIRTSYKMVKNNFEFVFAKLIIFGMLFIVASIALSMLPFIGEILKMALTPIVVIFMTKLYFITEKINKAEEV